MSIIERVFLLTAVAISVCVSLSPGTINAAQAPVSQGVEWIPWEHPDGTTHWYAAVVGGFTWLEARDAAEQLAPGAHLATATTEAENSFIFYQVVVPIFDPIGETDDVWLGGFQPPGSREPDLDWEWVTGESWEYTNWSPGEPNNWYGKEEDVLVYWGEDTWNDGEGTRPRGYVAEYTGGTTFEEFRIPSLTLDISRSQADADDLRLIGRFVLGLGTNGIDLISEDLTAEADSSGVTIPGGSFVSLDGNRYTFSGTIDGVDVFAEFVALGDDEWAFHIEAGPFDLNPVENQVKCSLRVGDDVGKTAVQVGGRLHYGDPITIEGVEPGPGPIPAEW